MFSDLELQTKILYLRLYIVFGHDLSQQQAINTPTQPLMVLPLHQRGGGYKEKDVLIGL